MSRANNDPLFELAEAAGVLVSYHDYKGQLRVARPDVLIRILQMLGIGIEQPEQAGAALREHKRSQWGSLVSPCAVAWDGHHALIELRVPASSDRPFSADIKLESGETRHMHGRLGELPSKSGEHLDGQDYACRVLQVPMGGLGYHRVTVRVGERSGECLVIAAPTAAYRLPRARRWGVFAPLYAVRRPGGGATGDLGDLARLADWTAELGGSFIGTLPLLASYLSEPFEPSPYSPVSRLFWNELYLDLTAAPGFEACEAARQAVAAPEFQAEAAEMSHTLHVDYRRQMAQRRKVLELLADAAWQSDAVRGQMEAYMQRDERADDYARFRAATEARGKVWLEWEAGPQRDGQLGPGDYDERIRRYHLYVQYAMDTQLASFGKQGRASLYLDLPVGVNRAAYDTWRDRTVFAMEASAGAPPDPLFGGGQNWGLAPLQPQRIRERGYRYLIDCVRNHVMHAGLLRVDHAMGLHRLFWVPEGVKATDGIYVYYPAGEMYAIFSLESHRHQCAVAGEDLGVVPDYVRPSMRHHGLSQLYVAQFSLSLQEGQEIQAPPSEAVASINTHDTPTLAGFWHGKEIEDFAELGLLTPEEAVQEQQGRAQQCRAIARFLHARGLLATPEASEDNLRAIMRALTLYLGASDAEMVQVNLEDLWLEPKPQNVPGTGPERPNWHRRMQPMVDEIIEDPAVVDMLRALNQARQQG